MDVNNLRKDYLDDITDGLLTEQQLDDLPKFIAEVVKQAIKKEIKAEDLINIIRDKLSYNELLFIATMFIGDRVVKTIEDFEKQLQDKLKSL